MIRVAPTFVSWQLATLQALASQYDSQSGKFPEDVLKNVVTLVGQDVCASQWNEKELKKTVMPFAKYKLEQASMRGVGLAALGKSLSFNEKKLLEDLSGYLTVVVGLDTLQVVDYEGDAKVGAKIDVYPGNPQVEFS